MSDSDEINSLFIDSMMKTLQNNIDISFRPKRTLIISTNESIAAGELISEYVNEISKTPVTATSDMRIPGWIDDKTLVIVTSDNIDDNLAVIRKMSKISKVIVISHHKIMNLCSVIVSKNENNKYEYFGEIIGNIVNILDSTGVISKTEVISFLSNYKKMISDDSTNIKLGKLKRNTVIFYPPNLKATASIWKTILSHKLNKTIFYTEYPEFDHNEIVGWCLTPAQCKQSTFIFLSDNNTVNLLSTIKDVLIEVVTDYKIESIEIKIDGKNDFEKNIVGIVMAERIFRGNNK